MDTWLPPDTDLAPGPLARRVQEVIEPMRCPWHGGKAQLLRCWGYHPRTWELRSTCCEAFRTRLWTEVYVSLLGSEG